MHYKVDGEEIDLIFKIKIDDLLQHITSRSNLKLKPLKKMFFSDSEFREKYVKLCMELTESIIKNELDDFDDMIDFAEVLENKLSKV